MVHHRNSRPGTRFGFWKTNKPNVTNFREAKLIRRMWMLMLILDHYIIQCCCFKGEFFPRFFEFSAAMLPTALSWQLTCAPCWALSFRRWRALSVRHSRSCAQYWEYSVAPENQSQSVQQSIGLVYRAFSNNNNNINKTGSSQLSCIGIRLQCSGQWSSEIQSISVVQATPCLSLSL